MVLFYEVMANVFGCVRHEVLMVTTNDKIYVGNQPCQFRAEVQCSGGLWSLSSVIHWGPFFRVSCCSVNDGWWTKV